MMRPGRLSVVAATAWLLAGFAGAGADAQDWPGDAPDAVEIQGDDTVANDTGRPVASPALADGPPLKAQQPGACPEPPVQVIVVLDPSMVGAIDRSAGTQPGGDRPGARAAARIDRIDRALLRERALEALEDRDGRGDYRVLLGTTAADRGRRSAAEVHVDRANRQRLLGRLRKLDDDAFIFLIDP